MKKFFIALVLTVLLASCTSVSDRLLGKWKTKGGAIMEFVKDGTLIVHHEDYINTAEWKLLNDKRLLLVDSKQDIKVEVSFQIEGKQLIITNPDGKVETSERVN